MRGYRIYAWCAAWVGLALAGASEPWRVAYEHGLELLETGRFVEAEQAFQSVLALRSNSAEAYNGLGLIAIQTGEPRSATSYFEKALQFQPNQPRILYNLLSAYLVSAQPVAALQCADRLLSLVDVDPDLYRETGDLLSSYGHVAHAVQFYRALQRSGPRSSVSEKLLAEADAKIRQDAENVGKLEQLLTSKPAEPAPYFELGLTWIKLGQFSRSFDLLKPAVEKFPASPEMLLAYALACYFTGRNNQAEQAYRRLIQMRPGSDQPYFALGNFYADVGRLENAATYFRRAVARNSRNYLNHYMLGVVLFRNQEYLKAAESLNLALKRNPEHADSNFWLGKIYLIQDEKQKALDAFERAVQLEPKHIGAYYQLGLLYARLGEMNKSKAALEVQRQLNAQLHKGLGALRMP